MKSFNSILVRLEIETSPSNCCAPLGGAVSFNSILVRLEIETRLVLCLHS